MSYSLYHIASTNLVHLPKRTDRLVHVEPHSIPLGARKVQPLYATIIQHSKVNRLRSEEWEMEKGRENDSLLHMRIRVSQGTATNIYPSLSVQKGIDVATAMLPNRQGNILCMSHGLELVFSGMRLRREMDG